MLNLFLWAGVGLTGWAGVAALKHEFGVRVEQRVREAKLECAHWLGFQEGADHFHLERPEPRVMAPELFDALTRDAQSGCRDDWAVLHEFHQGKVDGFRQTAEMEIELDLAEHDVEAEFQKWLRGREAA